MKHLRNGVATLLLASLTVLSLANTESRNGSDACRYQVFSWRSSDSCLPEARGGTTTGVPVTLDQQPSPQWLALQEEGLSSFERDRRAILAMAGPYRANFEFIETLGFTPDFTPAAPYQSWGTEYIYIVEDRNDFISLQHVMVMFTQKGDEITGPHVMKHWRQDWQYEKPFLMAYTGHGAWRKQALDPEQMAGTWAQAVYQVDDSPRYESYGEWQHNGSFSTWRSALTLRPLPRRESSVRDDYAALEGYNRHTILPTGWVQEEENLKLQLTSDGDKQGYVAKELGHNRYERITAFDFSAGDEYWQETGAFWSIVRQQWQDIIAANESFVVKDRDGDTPLFALLFDLADDFRSGKLKETTARGKVGETLNRYVATPEPR